jgi:hypothetical protein
MKPIKFSALLAVVLSISMLACSVDNSDNSNSNQSENLKGMISFLIETADTHVEGFLFEVRNPFDNSLVASRYVGLEPMTLPSRLLGGAGPDHHFADAYFVLPPGEYLVQAFPMQDMFTQSDECLPSNQELVHVYPSETTEVYLISQCDTVDNGGLDIVAVLNYSPIIVDLFFDLSKFFEACETVYVWVEAYDPDGDPLTYYWEVIGGPGGDGMEYQEYSFSFTSCTCEDYHVKVTVCDSFGLCAELTFPLHVGCGV